VDREIEDYLANAKLDLTATTDGVHAYENADYVIISTQTNYDEKKNYFDTSSVEEVLELVLKVNPHAVIVIKSTIPVGYTQSVCEKYHTDRILFLTGIFAGRSGIERQSVSVKDHCRIERGKQ